MSCHFCVKTRGTLRKCCECNQSYPTCDTADETHITCDNCTEAFCKNCFDLSKNRVTCTIKRSCTGKSLIVPFPETFMLCSTCRNSYKECEKCKTLLFGCYGCTMPSNGYYSNDDLKKLHICSVSNE